MCVWGGWLLIFEFYVHEIIQLAFFDFISSVLFLRCTCVDTCGYGSFTVVQRQRPHEIPTRLLEQCSLEMEAVPSHAGPAWPTPCRAGVPAMALRCIKLQKHEAQLRHRHPGKGHSKYVAEPWFQP